MRVQCHACESSKQPAGSEAWLQPREQGRVRVRPVVPVDGSLGKGPLPFLNVVWFTAVLLTLKLCIVAVQYQRVLHSGMGSQALSLIPPKREGVYVWNRPHTQVRLISYISDSIYIYIYIYWFRYIIDICIATDPSKTINTFCARASPVCQHLWKKTIYILPLSHK